jgi:hypothetical protein
MRPARPKTYRLARHAVAVDGDEAEPSRAHVDAAHHERGRVDAEQALEIDDAARVPMAAHDGARAALGEHLIVLE